MGDMPGEESVAELSVPIAVSGMHGGAYDFKAALSGVEGCRKLFPCLLSFRSAS